jgi:hypothetical protein
MAENKFSSDVISSQPLIEFFTKRASFIPTRNLLLAFLLRDVRLLKATAKYI